MTPENAIFICYRREDSNSAAYSLFERLKAAYGEKSVFLDHFGFRPGDEWREKTRPVLEQARVMIVVIHKDWISIAKHRFTDPNDPVRQELEIALARKDLPIIPVTIDRTPSLGTKDAEEFRDPCGDGVAGLLGRLFAKTTLKVRYDRDFPPDIQTLMRRLEEVPGVQRIGGSTSFDAGGLQLIRPWDMTAQRPKPRGGDTRASDLWMLQPKYRSIPLVGREEDLSALMDWLDAPSSISARLIVGRAGAGKTRIGFEFLWKVFAEKSERWDAGVVMGESLRQPRDWNAWVWRRPTLLMLDYAHALDESVTQMFLALARKAEDGNMPPLRILLLEREASADSGWFQRLLERENSVGGGPVRDLFEPPTPVPLHPLDTAEQRRVVLASTLQLAHEHDGQAVPAMPPEGANPAFDAALREERWRDPLYLMMAALVGRRRSIEQGGATGALLGALSLSRVDLAMEVAKHERRRLDSFVPGTHAAVEKRLLGHLAACATLCGGFTAEQALKAADEEMKALGLEWTGGQGALAETLHAAMPGEDAGSIAPVQPDIVAEAFIIETLRQAGLSPSQQRETVLRCTRRNPETVAAVLFHAFQNFSADDTRAALLLGWIGAVIDSGLNDNPSWLAAIGAALPHTTTVFRESAVRVTQKLYDLARAALTEEVTLADLAALAGFANNFALRLSDIGRRDEALEAAEEAVKLYRELVKLQREAFLPDLAISLNNVANMLSEVGRRDEALEAAEEAVKLGRELVTLQREAFLPGLAASLNNVANMLSEVGRRDEALEAAEEAVKLGRELVKLQREAFLPDLAMSLNNVANGLSAVGRRDEALEAAEEAVKLYRELVKLQREAFLPDLAMSLNNVANRLSDVGRRDEALEAAEEAVKLRRELVTLQREAFLPDLAASLNNVATMLSAVGRRDEALEAAEEAVKLYRELVTLQREAFLPNLATSLNNVATILGDVGRRDEALEAAEEAVKHYRELVTLQREAFLPDLAMSLGAMGQVCEANGEPTVARDCFHEGITLLLPLFQALPPAFASLMRLLCSKYVRVSEKLGEEPGRALLQQVIEVLEKMPATQGVGTSPD